MIQSRSRVYFADWKLLKMPPKFEKNTRYILLKKSIEWHTAAASFLPGEIIGDKTPGFDSERLLTFLPTDVGKLTDSEADLLMAVELEKRLSIYVENRYLLELGKTLKVGDEVLVYLEDEQHQAAGVIRYIGPHTTPNTHPGVWFKLELKVRSYS